MNRRRQGAPVSIHDGTRRYVLTRHWGPGPEVAWVMLNPSTADATTDDATITRCTKRARSLGFGRLVVVNLFSLRATDPRDLMRHPDPIGPINDRVITSACEAAGLVVVAWGAHGSYRNRDHEVTALLRESEIRPVCLGITTAGQPRHPGRLSYSTALRPYAVGSVT